LNWLFAIYQEHTGIIVCAVEVGKLKLKGGAISSIVLNYKLERTVQ
jgi:hypothetical protein